MNPIGGLDVRALDAGRHVDVIAEELVRREAHRACGHTAMHTKVIQPTIGQCSACNLSWGLKEARNTNGTRGLLVSVHMPLILADSPNSNPRRQRTTTTTSIRNCTPVTIPQHRTSVPVTVWPRLTASGSLNSSRH
jgi:hypothetical protein